jgi:hypothetical protein
MSEWQPIDIAPKDSTIIVCMNDYVVTAKWNDDQYAKKPRPYFHCECMHYMGKNWQRDNQPTHWMPLPPPPEQSNEPI